MEFSVDIFFFALIGLFCFGLLIAPYIWLYNCSYNLNEINKKLNELLKNNNK